MFSGLEQEFRSHIEVYMKYTINTAKYVATLVKPGSHFVFILSEHEKDHFTR